MSVNSVGNLVPVLNRNVLNQKRGVNQELEGCCLYIYPNIGRLTGMSMGISREIAILI